MMRIAWQLFPRYCRVSVQSSPPRRAAVISGEDSMPNKTLSLIVVAICLGVVLHAQDPTVTSPKNHHQYKLVDLGTFGGPVSYGSADGPGGRILNDAGVVSSYAGTTQPDPFADF